MYISRFTFGVVVSVSLLACGGRVDETTSTTSTGTGGSGAGHCDGSSFPKTTTTSDCPAADQFNTCTTQGQTCTWTTGSSAATWTCDAVMDCTGQTYVVWSNPTTKGDGCDGSSCCVPCAQAQPNDPCDALGFQCSYHDTSGGFPPLYGLICVNHAWQGLAVCEN